MSLGRLRNTFAPRHRGTEGSRACKRAKPKRDETWTQVQAERDLSSRYWHVIRPERWWLGRRAGREAGREGASCV